MKRTSLPAIRTRVERLARACGADAPQTLIVHWVQPYDTCPACGYDLDAHARDEALEKARCEESPDARPCRVLTYYWPHTLGACPRCGASLP
jgi:hypothetical protein